MQGRVHIWDSGNIIADIGTETVYYIRVLTLIYAKKGETKTYYRFNGHGDVIALANSSGAIIKRYKYDSFGVEENPGIFDTNVFRYCGEYYDVETKTIYLRARYYDAETGRFTQQDGWSYAVPGFLLSLNLYTYCWNNPVKYVDPSGNWPNWDKLLDAALTIAVGVTALVIASAVAPVTAVATLAVVATAVAGAGSVTMGLFDAGEAITGQNPMRDAYGDTGYELLEFGFTAVATMGAEFIISNPSQFIERNYDSSPSGHSYCEDDFKDTNVEIQQATDFNEDAKQRIENLDHSDGITKSNHVDGSKIHKGYKTDDPVGKEYKVPGGRVDYYDEDNNIIYELKPNNPASISRGIKQLQHYNQLIGHNSRLILELY